MSGEVTFADDSAGSISRLVVTARELFTSEGFAPAALIGGLAVTCRIGTVYRATTDVDTVTDGEAPAEYAVEYLADEVEAKRIMVKGVKVDVLATYPLPDDAADLPDDPRPRLFVLGHRWALETAGPLTVHVAKPDGSTTSADLTVATMCALLACKLHAIADRPATTSDKKGSDARDIYRLSRRLARGTSNGFDDAPFDLTTLVADEVERWLVDDATRTAGLINRSAGFGEPAIERDGLIATGRVLVDRLR